MSLLMLRQNLHRSKYVVLTGLVVLSLSGCSGSAIDGDADRHVADPLINPVSAMMVDPSTSVSTESGGLGIEPDTALHVADYDAPLSEEAHYFEPPKMDAPTKQVMQSERGESPVRLLGFVGGGSEGDESAKVASRKAILKIGDKMVTVGAGDSVEGIDVLSIQDRSVTMQRDRDRWTLALFDQPLVNRPTSKSRQTIYSGRKSRSSANDVPARPLPSRLELPSHPIPPTAPHTPAHPIVEMPEPPTPPDLSKIPGMDPLPGI